MNPKQQEILSLFPKVPFGATSDELLGVAMRAFEQAAGRKVSMDEIMSHTKLKQAYAKTPKKKNMDKIYQSIVDICQEKPSTIQQIADKMLVGYQTTKSRLQHLQREGQVKRENLSRGLVVFTAVSQ